MTTTTLSQNTTSSFAARLFGSAFIGGAVAAVANLVLYGVSRGAGVEFIGKFDPNQAATSLPVAMIVVASLVPAVFAALLALGLQRWTAKAPTVFATVAVVFGLVSLAPALGIAEASTGTRVVLALMHVVAGLGIGGLLYRTLTQTGGHR